MKGRKSDQEYFKRLLERIKLICTSERIFYQKITDIFAECSIDYDKDSEVLIIKKIKPYIDTFTDEKYNSKLKLKEYKIIKFV